MSIREEAVDVLKDNFGEDVSEVVIRGMVAQLASSNLLAQKREAVTVTDEWGMSFNSDTPTHSLPVGRLEKLT